MSVATVNNLDLWHKKLNLNLGGHDIFNIEGEKGPTGPIRL